jgi:hypothetical protein
MKHVYPVRHPPVPDAAVRGETTTSRDQVVQPPLPHEHDESSHSQAQGTAGQEEIGKKALRNATDGTADTDRGPVADKVYNEKLAPDRGATPPRR